MDLRGFLGLSDPIGFLTCLAGFSAQLWMTRRNRWLLAASIIFVAVFLLLFGIIAEDWSLSLAHRIPRTISSWLTALTQMWCIAMVVIFTALTARKRVPTFNRNRRIFLETGTAAACAAPVAAFSIGIAIRKELEVHEIEIKLPGVPKDLHGLRLVQLSDIHLGAFYTERDLERAIDAANHLKGDLAIVTGDLISSPGDPLEACLRQLARLKNTSGIWGCMGNHERFSGVQRITAEMGERLGIKFLRDEARSLRFGRNTLNLVGIDYQSMHSSYLVGTEELVEAGKFNLLLSHNPDVFPVATEKGFDLVLAGHTHGGQINLGLFNKNLNIAEFVTPYTRGLYTSPTSAVYVNSGIGTIGMPVRIGAPPEVTLIKLCAS